MSKEHAYRAVVQWTGNLGRGTQEYTAYSRDHVVRVEGKPEILGSSDPVFRGDKNRHNPEELLVASVSSCHMLWYLHLCASAGVVVLDYVDAAKGLMMEEPGGAGRFTSVTLNPAVTVSAGSDVDTARCLHHDAHVKCFVANSLNFPIAVEPVIRSADSPA
jgi:organic hydroperoxide reductase OsmC/OhrA